MFYSKSVVSSLSNANKLTVDKTIDQTNSQLRRVKGTGLVWLFKKILCILPFYRSSQHKKINEIYKKTFFELEVIRDKSKLDNKSLNLSHDTELKLKNLLGKVEKISKKSSFQHLRPNQIAMHSSYLGKPKWVLKSKTTKADLVNRATQNKINLLEDPLKSYFQNKSFNPKKHFENLRNVPEKERMKYWDEVSPLDIGVSTEHLKTVILPTLSPEDQKTLAPLIKTREKLCLSSKNWTKAINHLEERYTQKKMEIDEAKTFAENTWATIKKKYPQYLHLLNNKSYQEEFSNWVFRDRQDIGVFFESRACVEMMKDFSLGEHLATCKDNITFKNSTVKVPHIKVDGEGSVSWLNLPWDKIFIANEYLRSDLEHIDKEIGSLQKRDLYYMPNRGLTKHLPIENDYTNLRKLPYFTEEMVELGKNETPTADFTPIISYENNGPTLGGTHAYAILRIPEGKPIIDENGNKKIKMRVLPVGIARDTPIKESKKGDIIYVIKKICFKALAEENVILALPDQNEFYRNRKFTKLNKRIKLNEQELKKIGALFQEYQNSYLKGKESGKFDKSFQISLSNCTNLLEEIYQLIGKTPLPRKMPITHCISPGIGKKCIKAVGKITPSFVQRSFTRNLTRVFGAKGKFVQSKFEGNTTWLQRATIALMNENERFAH